MLAPQGQDIGELLMWKYEETRQCHATKPTRPENLTCKVYNSQYENYNRIN